MQRKPPFTQPPYQGARRAKPLRHRRTPRPQRKPQQPCFGCWYLGAFQPLSEAVRISWATPWGVGRAEPGLPAFGTRVRSGRWHFWGLDSSRDQATSWWPRWGTGRSSSSSADGQEQTAHRASQHVETGRTPMPTRVAGDLPDDWQNW